jgi:hypothetical protein
MSAVIGMNLHHQTGGYIPNLPGAVMRFSLFTNAHPGACWGEDDAQLNVWSPGLKKPPGGLVAMPDNFITGRTPIRIGTAILTCAVLSAGTD